MHVLRVLDFSRYERPSTITTMKASSTWKAWYHVHPRGRLHIQSEEDTQSFSADWDTAEKRQTEIDMYEYLCIYVQVVHKLKELYWSLHAFLMMNAFYYPFWRNNGIWISPNILWVKIEKTIRKNLYTIRKKFRSPESNSWNLCSLFPPFPLLWVFPSLLSSVFGFLFLRSFNLSFCTSFLFFSFPLFVLAFSEALGCVFWPLFLSDLSSFSLSLFFVSCSIFVWMFFSQGISLSAVCLLDSELF